MYKHSGKRILDLIIAGTGLIILSPLFLFVTILLWFLNNRKPFFSQPRPGLNGVTFTLNKFRTMKSLKDSNGNLLPDEQRITRFGNWLRRTSMDEIPQLWNVLKGDMSIIGPRPLLIEYLPLYNFTQQQRHKVKPGITGWAQINGRNAISWTRKFEYDVWYVQNLSFWLDVKILFLTALKLFGKTSTDETIPAKKFAG
ncbi:sugar transferase [Dyadobacter sp. NIV53]|uniref:sugar transferase n=1 Tax=Dyadobacter sp. NIV53 TaxID=2861765 RepID=UPI001C852328|nr:sugar transferase [Dyadobacter sp. NIV53]